MSAESFRIGFLPLVDAALPILARELGFAAREGVEIELVRDMTWATVRDRLLFGQTDAAHMIAPLAIATALGRDRPPVPMAVPFVLGLNGNAVTFSAALSQVVADSLKFEVQERLRWSLTPVPIPNEIWPARRR